MLRLLLLEDEKLYYHSSDINTIYRTVIRNIEDI